MFGRMVGIAVLAGLLLTGCAEQQPAAPPEPVTSPSPVTTSSSPSASTSATPAPTVSPAPTSGTVSLTVHRGAPPVGGVRGPAWLVVSAKPASSSVTISWTDAVSPGCGAVKDVWVQETASTVVLDLVRSVRRTGVVCPLVLAPRRATVALASPLGSRMLEEDPATPGIGLPCPSPGPATESVQVACPVTTG